MLQGISHYLCYLLRHNPERAALTMDRHGWVPVAQLIENVSRTSKYTLTMELLEQIVAEDGKGRYRFNEDHSRIKCCQGHSLPWVEVELTYTAPPPYLYHGTHQEAADAIDASGAIEKRNRHHVHLQADEAKAWQSARRWRKVPVVLQVDAAAMARDGYIFGRTDNDVWCTDVVPVRYICRRIDAP